MISRLTHTRPAFGRGILIALLLALLPVTNAFGQDDRVAELEARVAELEALVQQLVAVNDRPRSAAPAATPSADLEARAAAAAEQRVAELLAEEHAAQEEASRRHSTRIGGYVKADFLFSDFSGGPVASNSVGRDFYVPATVPVGENGESYTDFHAKETRIHLTSEHHLDSGDYVKAYIELDFLVGDQGDERISNSYNPRMRHAFVQWNKWLFGQTWNTIFNVGALPDLLDFVGPADSTVFGRQVMVRYTNGPWQLAIENPESTITPFGGGARITADDSRVPDVVARYNFSGAWGQWSIAGLLRELRIEDEARGIDSSAVSYGISLAGRYNVGERDDLRWMISAGRGFGRYVGLNIVNGAVLDADGDLEPIDTLSGFVSYRHFWNDRLRSSVVLSYFDASNDTALTGLGVTRKAQSLHANLVWSPIPKLDLGVEYIFADRELESGADGQLDRFLFSAKYAY